MPEMKTNEVRYEDAAEVRTLTGWCCKSCGRFWGRDEHMARYCCHASAPCGCGEGRTERGYTRCRRCMDRDESARWEALPKVDWDGAVPLCTWGDDRYFFDADSLLSYVDDLFPDDFEGGEAEEDAERLRIIDGLRLVLCTPDGGRDFDMEDYLADHLPDDEHGGHSLDCAEINEAVNAWIAAHAPFCWHGDGAAVSTASVREALGFSRGEAPAHA